jgi:hypothetical protein
MKESLNELVRLIWVATCSYEGSTYCLSDYNSNLLDDVNGNSMCLAFDLAKLLRELYICKSLGVASKDFDKVFEYIPKLFENEDLKDRIQKFEDFYKLEVERINYGKLYTFQPYEEFANLGFKYFDKFSYYYQEVVV